MSPPIGGSARAGSWEAADTIWLSSPMTGPPCERGGSSWAQSRDFVSVLAIQSTVGSKPTIVTAPPP